MPKINDLHSLFNSIRLRLARSDYYLKEDQKFVEKRSAIKSIYKLFLKCLVKKYCRKRLQNRKAVLKLKLLAQAQWSRAESRQRDKTYNKKTLAELEQLSPLPWKSSLPPYSNKKLSRHC